MTTGKQRFVLCIRSDGADDLEARKLYQVLPDRAALLEDHVRVVDESGEDYLYPADYFVPVTLPAAIARELAAPARTLRRSAAVRQRSGRLRVAAVGRTVRR
jgi:hypothetical protein